MCVVLTDVVAVGCAVLLLKNNLDVSATLTALEAAKGKDGGGAGSDDERAKRRAARAEWRTKRASMTDEERTKRRAEWKAAWAAKAASAEKDYAAQLKTLHDAGFAHDRLNIRLLAKCNGDVAAVTQRLQRWSARASRAA